MNSSYEQLVGNLNYLKMHKMTENLDDVLDMITKNDLSFTDGLIKLTQLEINQKEKNMITSMVKVAAFPHYKEFKEFDFDFQPSINKKQIMDFETLRFIEKNENILFLGTSGVGKTHLAVSIGITAAKKRNSTYFIKCHDLIQQLKKAKEENRLDTRLKHFTKYKVLIIDEIGYIPINREDAKLFFQLIDKRYEKRSTIITTNINFSEWDQVFCDPVMANAILDRLIHHSHVITITGKSYRIKNYMNSKIDQDG